MKSNRKLRMGVVVIAILATALALSAAAGAGPTAGPKAAHIAYMSMWDGQADIYAMDTEGFAQRNLTHDKTMGSRVDTEPAWSPDGQWVAFQRNFLGKSAVTMGSRLYLVRSDGTGLHALTSTPNIAAADRHPAWSPDGSTIVFSSSRTGHFELYTIKASGGGLVRLTFTKQGVDNTEPAWSPDGASIAFVRSVRGSTTVSATESIYSLSLMTTRAYRLTMPRLGQSDSQPAWSSNSMQIAFQSDRAGNEDVYVIDRKGNGLLRLTGSKSNELHPTWAPTGTKLALVSDRSGATEIYSLTVPRPGSTTPPVMRQLTFDKAFKANPAWERTIVPGPTS
jgi:Tol biopolymer transport system component